MAFDISTAKPESSGFDLSTAQPEPTFDLESFDPGGDIGVGEGPAPEAHRGLADQLTAIAETARAIGTGATTGLLGSVGGTLEQLVKEIAGGSFGPLADSPQEARESAERIAEQSALRASGGTLPPTTELGKERLGQLGEVLAPLAALPPVAVELGAISQAARAPVAAASREALQTITAKFGKNKNLIDQKTGLPAPVFEKELTKRGIDFGSIVDDVDTLPAIQGRKSVEQVVDQIVVGKIKRGGTDNFLADIRLEQGKIVPDDLGVELQRQGFRKGDVSAAKGANTSTKRDMNQMLKMTRQILSDSSKAKDSRPTDIPGEHVLGRFQFIRKEADTLRKDLNKLANKSSKPGENLLEGPGTVRGLKGLEIDTQPIEAALFSKLDDLRINIPDEVLGDTRQLNSFLKQRGVFVGSEISKNPTSQKMVKDVVDLLSEPGPVDAARAHNLKKQLDDLIDFNKQAKGLPKTGKNFAKAVRASLNDSIRDVSKPYAAINDKLSNAIGTMNEFERILGGSINVFKPGADKAIGQDLRGLLSNRKSRIALDNSLDDIDRTARNLGATFDVDARDLTQFANTLDERFGAVARTSLKGEFESTVKQAARGQAGIVDIVVGAGARKLEKARGINDTNALNAMQKLLRRKESR